MPRAQAGAQPGPVRLALARHFTLALEFQRASDILSTSVAPSWDEIGQLAAFASIRPLLNYFLDREIAARQAAARG